MATVIGLDHHLTGATAEQQAVVDLIVAGPRGSVPSPFYAMLDSPPLTLAIQEVGAMIRFGSTLPDAQRELAVLATAGAVGCGYEWNYHAPIGRAAGLTPAAIAATLPDASADQVGGPDATLIGFCRALAARNADIGQVAEAVTLFGRTGATEIIAIVGYYALLASFIKLGGFDRPFATERA